MKLKKRWRLVAIILLSAIIFAGCFSENDRDKNLLNEVDAAVYVFWAKDMLRTWNNWYDTLERGVPLAPEQIEERYQEGVILIHDAYEKGLLDEQRRDEALSELEKKRGTLDPEKDIRTAFILEESVLTLMNLGVPTKHSKSHKTLELAMIQLLLSVEEIRSGDYERADYHFAAAAKHFESWKIAFEKE